MQGKPCKAWPFYFFTFSSFSRWPCSPREEERDAGLTPKRAEGAAGQEPGQSLQGQAELMFDQHEEEERRIVTKMQTSESEPSTAPSTARSESSDSMNSLNAEKLKTSSSCFEQGGRFELQGSLDNNDNEQIQAMPVTPLNILEVLDDIIDVDETSHDGFWDTSDEDAFVENKNKLMQKVRKVTVVQNSSPWTGIGQIEGFDNFEALALSDEQHQEEETGGRRKTSEDFFSQDSLEQGIEEEESERRGCSTHQMSSSSGSSSTEEEEDTDKVNFRVMYFDAPPSSSFQSQCRQSITLPLESDLAESHLSTIFGFSPTFLKTFGGKLRICKKISCCQMKKPPKIH